MPGVLSGIGLLEEVWLRRRFFIVLDALSKNQRRSVRSVFIHAAKGIAVKTARKVQTGCKWQVVRFDQSFGRIYLLSPAPRIYALQRIDFHHRALSNGMTKIAARLSTDSQWSTARRGA